MTAVTGRNRFIMVVSSSGNHPKMGMGVLREWKGGLGKVVASKLPGILFDQISTDKMSLKIEEGGKKLWPNG